MGIPIKTMISRTKKITLFASVFCGVVLLVTDVNFVLVCKLRLHRRSHVLLHTALPPPPHRFFIWWEIRRFHYVIPIDHRIRQEDARDKKNIYRYISASREIEAEGGMLPPPASLSWVLMYDLKPMSGAALDGCLRSVKVGSVRNSSFAKGCKFFYQ